MSSPSGGGHAQPRGTAAIWPVPLPTLPLVRAGRHPPCELASPLPGGGALAQPGPALPLFPGGVLVARRCPRVGQSPGPGKGRGPVPWLRAPSAEKLLDPERGVTLHHRKGPRPGFCEQGRRAVARSIQRPRGCPQAGTTQWRVQSVRTHQAGLCPGLCAQRQEALSGSATPDFIRFAPCVFVSV